jgi:hypothetical protein
VAAEQVLGGGMHGGGVQGGGDVPDATSHQRRAAAAVEDAEAVGSAVGGEARVPVFRHHRGIQYDDGIWLHVVVQGIADRLGAVAVRQVDMRDLTLGVDSRIGPAGDDAGDGLAAVQVGGGLFEHRLDGQAVDLALPADEWGAVVFK